MTMDYSTTTTTTTMISKPFTSATQPLDRDIKLQYKCVYNLLKQFEQEKQKIISIDGIFEPSIESLRNAIVDQSTALIYQTEFEVIGRKCREILWFKGYYDLISLAKRLWKKNQSHDKRGEEQISNLIIEGISHFKMIIVNLERKFSLDLRDVVDFSFLDTYEKNLYTAVASQNSICHNENRSQDEVAKYAMETIHALLISLGDLHRYFIDFDFTMPKISKDFVANYYFEAFKLNPKTGMAQNQLGTLLSGINYNLDSIYHYLYSLVCPVPFDVSDSRVTILFQNNSSYLEKTEGANEKCDTIGLRDFIARYLLVIDVFFYDKEIIDFNSLCHCMLLDFRKMLQSNRIELTGDMLFKMIAMFFFCLIKLKTIGSNKIHSLHAFLVALCAELVSACSMKLNKFIESHEPRNAKFQSKYVKNFETFEQTVRDAREKHKRYIESIGSSASHTNDESNDAASIKGHLNGKLTINKLSDESIGLKNGRKFSLNGHEDMATNSSGRERESDAGKSTPLSSQTKNVKRRGNLRRRRRRALSEHSNSDLSYFEDSECEMDTDFSTDEDSADENGDSWYSSESGEEEDEAGQQAPSNGDVEHFTNHIGINDHDDDDEDVVIEDEHIIYPTNGAESKSLNGQNNYERSIFGDFMSSFKQLQLYDEENQNGQNNFTFEQSNIANPFDFKFNLIDNVESTLCNEESGSNITTAPEKLRFKQKYNKTDPNIIIEFFQHDNIMVALKLLFDWLRGNNAIIINCFTTNPEFIDKIFDLLNVMNIDIFTRKVYFERFYIETENVRENLRSLFDIRQTIPLKEDVLLKEFSVFDVCQRNMDWTLPLKQKITENEETILRIFLFIDFGFSLCKMKKFDYNFCSRTRNFIKVISTRQRSSKRPRKRGRRNRRRVRNRSRNRRSNRSEMSVLSREEGEQATRSSTDEMHHAEEEKKPSLKKGYLKNRQQNHLAPAASAENNDKAGPASSGEKHQLMGKLWLKHEIEVLEAKMSKSNAILTPYLVVDSKVLSNHLDIVKKFVKAKKFVVLIPSAVLAELDELKKTSDGVRNTIRWLEREFTNGSRFIRLQRNNETKPLTLIKVPKKLDREASTFMHIAQFCNYINETHTANGENILDASMAKPNVVTFLTGGKLADKKLSNISSTGILDAIGINYEQINDFYAKYKKK